MYFRMDTHVGAGDIVHIHGDLGSDGPYRITDDSGLIVVHPDLLISGTSVVSGVQCMRRWDICIHFNPTVFL